jgi:hypothetical protein
MMGFRVEGPERAPAKAQMAIRRPSTPARYAPIHTDHSQKKLIFARHNKLIIVQRNKLIIEQHKKLT